MFRLQNHKRFYAAPAVVLSILLAASAILTTRVTRDHLTEENVERIHEGMSTDEVVAIFGREPDSKYGPSKSEVWYWEGPRLLPTDDNDDPEMLILNRVLVEFDGSLRVKTATLAPTHVEASWYRRMLARLGF